MLMVPNSLMKNQMNQKPQSVVSSFWIVFRVELPILGEWLVLATQKVSRLNVNWPLLRFQIWYSSKIFWVRKQKHVHLHAIMVVVAQLVRALDCGSRGRRFETGLPPFKNPSRNRGVFFLRASTCIDLLFSMNLTLKFTKIIHFRQSSNSQIIQKIPIISSEMKPH